MYNPILSESEQLTLYKGCMYNMILSESEQLTLYKGCMYNPIKWIWTVNPL